MQYSGKLNDWIRIGDWILGIRIGDSELIWGLRLGIGIGHWDSGLGLGIGYGNC